MRPNAFCTVFFWAMPSRAWFSILAVLALFVSDSRFNEFGHPGAFTALE
jgi:hypothetical protein